MIDQINRTSKEELKEKVRRRMHAKVDPDNYEYIPAKKQIDYYDNDVAQRVGIYVRVSTDSVMQTTSYELQKRYYEDFVVRHPNWTLVGIYADEGISGTSLKHRDEFNRMIADAKAGKLDIIVTKSVSRFARNVMICIGVVRELAELQPPVGVFFESECIFSLNDDSQMALSFQATMAEEESHTRSRSMETSLRMRLDNGIPLTPKLLGYTHDGDGNLVINQDEAPTVKLAFFMYLYGYSTQQIADAFTAMERKSYLGNTKWTSSGIIQILRNERHCGDVLTRKTFTPNFHDHLAKRNRGERPQSRYLNHHEAIISRDDFIAVQKMLDNAKYRNKSILPELRVIETGKLKGFVTINPRWAGFTPNDYLEACHSAYKQNDDSGKLPDEPDEKKTFAVEAGDFDLRGFEVARSEYFEGSKRAHVTFGDKKMKFNSYCVQKYGEKKTTELLINPILEQFAVRSTSNENRSAVTMSSSKNGKFVPKPISTAAFEDTLFALFDWDRDCRYRMTGSLYEQEGELAFIFDARNAEAFFKPHVIPAPEENLPTDVSVVPITEVHGRIRAIPQQWVDSFGKPYYEHEQDLPKPEDQNEEDWRLRMEGRLFETGKRLNVTGFDELRAYIRSELETLRLTEVSSGNGKR